MRSKKALINIIISLIFQLVSIVCGLIVPRLIISTYGSSVNGLVSSINQFLGYIVLMEAGVGGVVRAALYKYLEKNDIFSISKIIKATEIFFKKLAYIFIIYLLVISIIFPHLVNNVFSYYFTLSLVLIIGISTFFQYYFGISYQILLQADQRQYITSILQIITMITNTVLVVILIKFGASIHVVKLGSSVIFVIRPILLNMYVNRKYKIIKNCNPDNNSIEQRWDGFGHHLAFFVTNSTDIVMLTLFSNIKEVSVYSVYYMVVISVKKLTVTFSSSLEAAFGNMIAKDEKEVLDRNFRIFEFSSFTITTILFTTTSLLILPFISLYTSGINDVNYYRPLFAYVLIVAQAVYCIRIPYSSIVLAAGHFKQTRNGAFAEALINIFLSFFLVNLYGIVGVAIGTLFAMIFRTIQYAWYLSKNILERSIWEFVKKTLVYFIAVIIIILITNLIPKIIIDSYVVWFIYALEVILISSIVTIVISLFFYCEDMKNICLIIKRMIKNISNK